MFNRQHSDDSRQQMVKSASERDNTNIGKYERTAEHREELSKLMIGRIAEGKMKRTSNTKPERDFMMLCEKIGVPVRHQFLIQFRSIKKGKRFRHLYDFKIEGTNILVEVDGDYWHSQPEIAERDKICEQIALEKGYQLVRFKQSEMERNPEIVESFLKKIKKTL